MADQGSAELTAVVAALAGVRRGQVFTVLGPSRSTTGVDESALLAAALSAAAGGDACLAGPVEVAVVLRAHDVPSAVARLRPGGRLVAVAADGGGARRTAAAHGLLPAHVASMPGRLAWSAVLPGAEPAAGT